MSDARRLALMILTGSLTFGCGAASQSGSQTETDSGSSSGTSSMPGTGTTSGQTASGTTRDDAATTGTDTFSVSDTVSDTDTDTDTESSSSGPEMACEGSCVSPAPEGWSGPVARIALADGATEGSACGGAFPESEATGFSTLDPPASSCSCGCGSPTGGACESVTSVEVFNVVCPIGVFCGEPDPNINVCNSVDETFSVGSGVFVDDDRLGIRVIAAPPSVALAPGCVHSDDSVLSPPVPRDHFELCAAPAEAGACVGDDVCTADIVNPFEAGACIWTEGESDCPESDYTERTLLHESVEDTRECSACSCGEGVNASCAGVVQIIASYRNTALVNVSDPPRIFAADGVCSIPITPIFPSVIPPVVNFTVIYIPQTQTPTSPSCQSSGGQLTGAAAPAGTRTVCCLPS